MGIGGGDDDRSAASFVRGLTIGALLGAAVAGSSLWTRRRSAKKARQTAADGRSVSIGEGIVESGAPPPSGVGAEDSDATSRVDAPDGLPLDR